MKYLPIRYPEKLLISNILKTEHFHSLISHCFHMYRTEFYFLNIILQGWIDIRTNFLPIKQFFQSKKWYPSENKSISSYQDKLTFASFWQKWREDCNCTSSLKKLTYLQYYQVQTRSLRALFLSNHENVLQEYLTFLTIK